MGVFFLADITFILPGYPWCPVGGFRTVYEYANILVERGHNVTVVHPRKMKNSQIQKNIKTKIINPLFTIKEIIFKPDYKWQFIDKRVNMIFVNELKSVNIPNGDFIFATSWETAEYVNNYSSSKGEKYYLIQGFETFSGSKERIINTWKFPMQKIFISNWLYEKGKKLKLDPNTIICIHNGISHDKYKIISDIKDRNPQISMIYNTSPNKGSIYGINALKILKKKYPEIKATLFGVCPRPKLLPRWIDYYQDPPQKIIVEDIYNKSSIFLCSSISEGWGLPGAEAMSCGCALVSTNTGGVNDYAINLKTAILTKPENTEMIVESIKLLLNNDQLRRVIALNGYKSMNKFNWDKSTDKLIKFMGLS